MYEKYNHHGVDVWVDSDLKGQHRDHCLCFSCAVFQNNTDQKCKKADELYEFCKRNHMTTPVFECPDFQEK